MIVDSSEIRAFCHLLFCDWTPDGMHGAYRAIVAACDKAGVPLNKLSAIAPGIGSRFGSFKHKRHRLEATGFQNVTSYALTHMIADGTDVEKDCKVNISIYAHFRSAQVGWIPAMIGGPAVAFIELLPVLASLGKARYGHFFHRNTLNKERPWWLFLPAPIRDGLLFDVYHHTYLNDAHLDAPFGRTAMTLREWIEDNPAERGELNHFTDILTEWKPPVRNIPILREQLFRAGRLYYRRFFAPYRHRLEGYSISATAAPKYLDQTVLMPEVFYRPNIHDPWEWSGPIPEIYSAKYYEGSDDPALVLPLDKNF